MSIYKGKPFHKQDFTEVINKKRRRFYVNVRRRESGQPVWYCYRPSGKDKGSGTRLTCTRVHDIVVNVKTPSF